MTKGDKERYRVQAAIAAMQGLASVPYQCGFPAYSDTPTYDAKRAVEYADALMAELGLGEEE